MGRLEIDLIARKERLVAFVEVKTRLSTHFGTPFQAVTWHKQREIGRVAQAWMDRHGRATDTYRFDVIGITQVAGRPRRVEHLVDAFRLERR
jgi:putative endonuclease